MDEKIYIVKTSSSAQELENWMNEMADRYELVGIADTNAYITAAMRIKDKLSQQSAQISHSNG